MSQIPERLQSEIFQRKPYLKNYFFDYTDYVSYKSEENRNSLNYVSYNTQDQSNQKSNQVYQLETSKSGGKYLSWNSKPLASTYDPLKQAKRTLESPSPRPRDLIVVFGLGNPHIIEELISVSTDNQVVILIDADTFTIFSLWDDFLIPFLGLPGKHLFAGESFIQLLWNYMDGLNIERMSGLKIYKNQASIALHSEFYSLIEERLHTVFSSKMSDLLTKFEFETLWTSNIISNSIRFNEKNNYHKISDLPPFLSDIPAVLISAGPSLRAHLPFLNEIRDKVFIMSCDTSLKVLLKFDIIPDAVYTLDAQLNSVFHFLGEDLSGIPLFADLVTSPYLTDIINPKSYVFSTTAKFIHTPEGGMVREVTAGGEFADKWIGEVGDIQSGGSVATTAFDALRYLGAKQIYFLGQDLAYTGREIHSTGTHHNEKWLGLIHRRNSLEKINEVVVRKRDTRYVESIQGGKVLTDYVLDLYRSWFEDSASSLEGFRLINVGEMGAKIDGMENIHPNEAIKYFSKAEDHNYPWLKLPPWKESKTFHSNSSPMAQDAIRNDLWDIQQKLDHWRTSENYNSLIQSWFKSRLYLKKILRKTEIYIARHRDELNEERKRKLFIDTIEKEIKKLNRKLYPILGPSLLGGESAEAL